MINERVGKKNGYFAKLGLKSWLQRFYKCAICSEGLKEMKIIAMRK